MSASSCFERYGPATPNSPVVISVPHAGQVFTLEMRRLARLSPQQLRPLEDRHADALITQAVAQGAQAIVAQAPRAWIDLNRAEREFDPAMMAVPFGVEPLLTAKVRGGLGLIPRRVARNGEIWRHPITPDDFRARRDGVHRPYHEMLAQMLDAARIRFGAAVLIDVHSMPSVADRNGEGAPQIVIGDRFGKSASGQFTARALAEAEGFGLATAVNAPYAGGYILDRHGAPQHGIHALQIEVDRALYLDPAFDLPGAGLPQIQCFIARLAAALADEACCTVAASHWPIAAE